MSEPTCIPAFLALKLRRVADLWCKLELKAGTNNWSRTVAGHMGHCNYKRLLELSSAVGQRRLEGRALHIAYRVPGQVDSQQTDNCRESGIQIDGLWIYHRFSHGSTSSFDF